MSRVAVIGLDAAEWWVVDRLMSEDRLPNLSRLRARSAECRLRNVVPYRAESAWTQFNTGRDGWANRYWTITDFDPASYESYCIGAFTGRPFYALGDQARVVAFDIPHSALSDQINGVQVTSWGAHAPQYPRASRPAGLLTEIDGTFGPHPVFENDGDLGWNDAGYIDRLAGDLTVGARRRFEIARWLSDRVPDWDLFITVASEFHSGGHHLWHGVDPAHALAGTAAAGLSGRRMAEVAGVVDAAVGGFIDALPADTVVVVFAVHGMEPATDLPSLLLLPELLHRHHFGRPMLRDPDQRKWRKAGCPPVIPSTVEPWAIMGTLRELVIDPPWPRPRFRSFARRVVPPAAYRRIRTMAGRAPLPPLGSRREPIPPEATENELRPEALRAKARLTPLEWEPAMWYQRFWPKMPWFILPSFSGDAHVRINLEGRERHGTVPLEDYQAACNEVVGFARQCRDPRTGRSAVADVFPLRDSDPMDPHGPDSDLAIRFSGAHDALEHPEVGMVGPLPQMRTGSHTPNGFAFFSGPGIDRSDLGERSAFDLPPTILRLLGLDIPKDMRGISFSPEFVRGAPVGADARTD